MNTKVHSSGTFQLALNVMLFLLPKKCQDARYIHSSLRCYGDIEQTTVRIAGFAKAANFQEYTTWQKIRNIIFNVNVVIM